jgi:hypothetical protein
MDQFVVVTYVPEVVPPRRLEERVFDDARFQCWIFSSRQSFENYRFSRTASAWMDGNVGRCRTDGRRRTDRVPISFLMENPDKQGKVTDQFSG